jgi:hypothetical protein
MGEDARKGYERRAAKAKSKEAKSSTVESKWKRYAMKMMGLLALLIVVLGAGACLFHKPVTGEIAELRALFR